jgi:TPR repeat protein
MKTEFGEQMAGLVDHATAAFQRGDYERALSWYREAALHEKADAQYALGVMYVDGRGTTQDDVHRGQWRGGTRLPCFSSGE